MLRVEAVVTYPLIEVFPPAAQTPWRDELVRAFAAAGDQLDSRATSRPTRKAAEARELVRAPLEAAGFELGNGPRASVQLTTASRAPDLRREFPVDAFHRSHGVALEIDAGRAAQSNTSYRALLRAALLEEVRHLVLAVPIHYRHMNAGKQQTTPAFRDHVELLAVIDSSPRLGLPFHSITVLGW